MAKKKNNNGLYIGIAIIIAAVIIAPNLNFEFFSTINENTQDVLDNQISGDCYATLDKQVVFVGDEVGGAIRDGANTLCEVYATDGTTWTKVAEGTTNINGDLRFLDRIMTPGIYTFRVICGTCITKAVTLQVNPLDDDPDPVPDDDDGYDVGDNVGSGAGSSGDGNFGDDFITSPIMLDWTTGGPYILGVKITRSWNYKDPECMFLPQQYPMEFSFYDSNGMAWQKYDYAPVNNVVDTVCPVVYHEDAPWKFVVSVGIQDCEVEYDWQIQPFICEVLD